MEMFLNFTCTELYDTDHIQYLTSIIIFNMILFVPLPNVLASHRVKDNDEDTQNEESELCGLPAAKDTQRIHPRSMNKGKESDHLMKVYNPRST